MSWPELAAHLKELLAHEDATPGLLPHQHPPTDAWTGWVLLAGRGAGKSYASMRWLNERCEKEPGLRARVIAPTFADGVASCVQGPNGLLAQSKYRAVFKASEPGGSVVVYPNGSRVWIIGTPHPADVDRLRALTNIEVDVFEEAFANRMLTEAWDNAEFSRRRGTPRFVVTSTPRPHKLHKEWAEDTEVQVTRAKTDDNPHNDPKWVERQRKRYAGTRLYRQEFLGEVVEDVEGALWTYTSLERSAVPYAVAMDACTRFVVGVDPASGPGTTGIVVMGKDTNGHLYLLEDYSLTDATPHQWALAAATAAAQYGALVVAETNQGGKMVKAVMQQASPATPVYYVTASQGKRTRAEPVAVLWEADDQTAHITTHDGKPDALDGIVTQMTEWVPGTFSPDRVDAMVWAATHLLKYSASPPATSEDIATMQLPGL